MKQIKLLVLFALVSGMAYAGGYRVSLQGHRQLAMGHTGVAVVNSAEILFFNPAGLNHLEGKLNASVGGFGVFSNTKYQNSEFGTFSETESEVGTPLYAYVSYKVTDWFSAGLAVYTPYGSNVTWPTDWEGSHLVNEIDLQAIFIQPTVAFNITDKLSIGGGPIFVTGGVEFNRNANRTLTDEQGNRSNIALEDSGVTNWGYTVALMFKPTENLTFGATYRSEITLESREGEAEFTNFPNSSLTPDNQTVGFAADLPLPAELTLGLSYKWDKFLFAFDYNRAYWEAYESLDIRFDNPDLDASRNPRNYSNASIYRFGVQYQAMEKLILRAGYYFDESPVQSGFFAPETPRNDAHGYTAGFSYNITSDLAIDVSFLYNRFEEIDESYDSYQENGQQVPFEGSYITNAFVTGLGLTYRL